MVHLFKSIYGDEQCEPMDVYIAVTVDQIDNVVNAFRLVPVKVCSAHRLNPIVTWGLDADGAGLKNQSEGAPTPQTDPVHSPSQGGDSQPSAPALQQQLIRLKPL